MPTALPSDVVQLIDTFFPSGVPGNLQVNLASSTNLSAIVGIAELVPAHLITLKGNDLAAYICSTEAIRTELAILRERSAASSGPGPTYFSTLRPLSDFGNLSPVQIIRDSLKRCPDSIPSPGTSELPFFRKAELREALQLEISDVAQALADREWKAATVLGGAALEALLFWAIKGMANELAALADKSKDPIDKWELQKFIEVARKLGLIEEKTRKLADLARDARNLVHPGAVLTERRACDKASSLTVAAAVEAVARDIAVFCEKHGRQL
jgi:hypothetical protein